MKIVIEIPQERYERLDYIDTLSLKEIIKNGIPYTERIGHWIKWEEEEWYGKQGKCSECGHITIDKGNYCTNCGAEMSESKWYVKNVGEPFAKGLFEGLKEDIDNV